LKRSDDLGVSKLLVFKRCWGTEMLPRMQQVRLRRG
jgi:hypothetical protein